MASNRLLIAQGLVAMLQGVQNGALYNYVKLGALFDPSPYTSWAEVMFLQGKSGPYSSGGNLVGWQIDDQPVFKITSGWPYDPNSTTAEENMLTAMDTLNPVLHSHYQIPNPNSPTQPIATIYSLLEDQTEHAMRMRFPNGKVYLLWETYCTTKQLYTVQLVQP